MPRQGAKTGVNMPGDRSLRQGMDHLVRFAAVSAVALAAHLSCIGDHASATTFVELSTAEVAMEADLAVVGVVRGIRSSEWSDGSISTTIGVEIERVVFGTAPDSGFVEVREPGGRVDGRRQWFFGTPSFVVGEEVLLFLHNVGSGVFRTVGMSMGKYEISQRGRERLVRRSSGPRVSVIDPHSGARRAGFASTPDRLSDVIVEARRAHRGLGRRLRRRSRRSREVPLERVSETWSEFTFLEIPARWFEPDEGFPVRYFIDSAGDPTLGAAASIAAVEDALAAWTEVPTSALVLESAGLTDAAPLSGCPDDNRIVFNDPFGEVAELSMPCRGVLALGGFCDSDETRVVNGREFKRILTGKLTLNNGWGDCPIWTACNVAEIITHEIGHTIGLGHSADDDATMARFSHFDERCASLRMDDENGITFMYPLPTPTATVTATITETPTESPTPSVTDTPTSTLTPTRTPRPPTRTRTPTPTLTATRTRTPTRTRPFTRTPTGSLPPTASATATATASETPTATSTPPPETSEPFLVLVLRVLRKLLAAFRSLSF